MVKRKPPYQARIYSFLLYISWCAALQTTFALALSHEGKKPGNPVPLPLMVSASPWPVSSDSSSPSLSSREGILSNILTKNDIALYEDIFRSQKKADWVYADTAIAQLGNKLLLGHVLAERYLNRRYTNSEAELADWLNHYSDHPQAAEIYALAISKYPSLKKDVPLVHRQATLEGYGDDNGLAVRGEDSPYAPMWHAGLQAWKAGRKNEAALLFSNMAGHRDAMSPWMASAAAYWAYRSYNAIGKTDEANEYLKQAALQPRSFYGILARKQLNQKLDLDTSPVALTDSDVLEMVGDQTIRRIVALTQAGYGELAEKELRARFIQADDKEKPQLLALAHELGLASVQISMAKQLGTDGHELDFARYPVPYWQPEGGFKVDPLLIFSLVRQESGFRTSAVSPGGALGLMQLMPQTASFMQKKMNNESSADRRTDNTLAMGNVSEPVLNVTLGQNYVEHLLNNELVEGNLFYLLAAYNAGPGRLQEWKSSLGHNNDPLLFVESIPYGQTRHYVMQVMTNYWIYSELVGVSNYSLAAVVHGHWPSYDQYPGTVATGIVADNEG